MNEFRVDQYIENCFSGGITEETIKNQLVRLIGDNENYMFEVSRKVLNNTIFQSRIAFIFMQEIDYWLEKCFDFFHNLEAKGIGFDFDKSIAMLDTLDTSKICLIVLGFDLRQDPLKSRLKLQFLSRDSPELMYRMLHLVGYSEEILNLIMNNTILIGFDYYLNNKFSIKLYLRYGDFHQNIIPLLKFKNFFIPRVRKAISISSDFFISFRGMRKDKKFVYFCNANIPELIKCLEVKPIPIEILTFQGKFPYIFGAYYDQIKKRKLSEYNLYYMLKY